MKRIDQTGSEAVFDSYPESLQAKASRSDMQRNCETDDGLEFVTALIIKSRLRYVLLNMDRLFFHHTPFRLNSKEI